jgi:predicted enzyme related to lactoylglutathione lyase
MAASPSSFVWYELLTTDPEAAETFYAAVVGWSPQPWDSAESAYTIMKAGEHPVAGVMRLPPEVSGAGGRPGWVGYIGVADVDAATDRLQQAGGAVHRAPATIRDVGRFSVVSDPQGAAFMLFTPSSGRDDPRVPAGTPGQVGWRELYAADLTSAFDFYRDQFGWTKAESVDMGPMGIYQLFAAGGDPVGGMMRKPDVLPAPVWNYYFNVPAIDAAAAQVTNGGGRILSGPHPVPGGSWIVQCMDPQGAMFALTAPSR